MGGEVEACGYGVLDPFIEGRDREVGGGGELKCVPMAAATRHVQDEVTAAAAGD